MTKHFISTDNFFSDSYTPLELLADVFREQSDAIEENCYGGAVDIVSAMDDTDNSPTSTREGARLAWMPAMLVPVAQGLPDSEGFYFTDRGVRYFGGEEDPHWEDENDLIDTDIKFWIYLSIVPTACQFERIEVAA